MPLWAALQTPPAKDFRVIPTSLFSLRLIICLIVLSLNLLGDGLRDAFDPKLRK
jgi:oligopeptide transport system permease protein